MTRAVGTTYPDLAATEPPREPRRLVGPALALAVGVALALVISLVSLSIVGNALDAPAEVSVKDAVATQNLTMLSNPTTGGHDVAYTNVTSSIVTNGTGVTSNFSMSIRAGVGAYVNATRDGVAFVTFVFMLDVSGTLRGGLDPVAVVLYADDMGVASGESDRVQIGSIGAEPGAFLQNASFATASDGNASFSGSGSANLSANLLNQTSHSGQVDAYEFNIGAEVQVSALPIPLNSTATNTFHLRAILSGLNEVASCTDTVDVADSYYDP